MQLTAISEIAGVRETLRATFRAGVPRSLEWRKHQLHQLARMVQENAEAFSEAVSKDLGKPKVEMYYAEIGAIVPRSLTSAEKLEEWAKPNHVDTPDWQKPWSSVIYKAAKGTVLIIAPWNYPMALSLQPLIGAIAAGCCAVIKPSEISSHYSALLAEMAPKYLDQRAFRIVLGGVPETTALLELQWDHIFYTGNSRIARVIAAAAAKHLTPTTLELGGKCPVILDPSFDLKIAARRILWGKALNCGQTCVTPDYVLIPATHQDAFVSAVKECYLEFFPEGSLHSASIARIVSSEHHTRLMNLLERTKGKVVSGGKSKSLKIEVKDVAAADSLMEGEIFGPILPIIPVNTMEDAIEFVRDRPHPLVLYAFTENAELKQQILQTTLSGSLVFNDTFQQLAVDELPLGGVGESGHGRQLLKYTFEEFSYERGSIDLPKEYGGTERGSIDLPKEAEPFLAARYPPYTDENFKVMAAAAFLEIPAKT